MGIPAYYKKLTHTISGLISVHHHDVTWLFMDFNCLIYHCIASQPAYIDAEHIQWEQGLIESVISYCKDVVKEVAPSEGVYIAIDGVVPMAKMRQQRLRRFKSVWEQKKVGNVAKWNTNAITPGTVFMDKLCNELGVLCAERGWKFSSCLEPGEGEHKIMTQWRLNLYKGSIAVYGLDADLIVLSLLGQHQCSLGSLWLFRESDCGFDWFSIDLLRDWLCINKGDNWILTYCFTMSVLGNDFLPSSLGLKMRDGGHDELLRCLTAPLIDSSLNIIEENVVALFFLLAQTEHSRIIHYVQRKQKMLRGASDTALGEHNWPLTQIEEGLFSKNWFHHYREYVGKNTNMVDVCKTYINGIKWIWSYYTGKSICFNWFYTYTLPPLWSDLIAYLNNHEKDRCMQSEMPLYVQAQDIQPSEQLCLVLPLESWSLIPACSEKIFPMIAPHFFPDTFAFESVGKRFFWECEALIPIPTIVELKALIHAYHDTKGQFK